MTLTQTRAVGRGSASVTDDELSARFQPVFDRIAVGAVDRERDRALPFEPIAWLREAGFGTVRVPVEHGGLGASIRQLFRLLIALGEADSNLPQALRGHFAFVESRLRAADNEERTRWLERVAAGVLVGNAQAEKSSATGTTTTLRADGGVWRLDGRKYYSTGAIFADWVLTTARLDEEPVSVLVPTDVPGVARSDDWDGFGQRLTGSGTTVFDNVRVEPHQILRFEKADEQAHLSITAFYQVVLLSALSGIARASVRDTVEFVRGRTRTFGVVGTSVPADDPLVQSVVGRLSSLAFAAEELTLAAADRLDDIDRAAAAGAAAGLEDASLHSRAQLAAYRAQQIVLPTVLEATTLLFEVGGASATSDERRLDRHWRNARTISSHNPAIQRERLIGDVELNGVELESWWVTERRAREAKA